MIERLKKRPDFLAAASGRRFRTSRISVHIKTHPPAAEGDGGSPCRVGFTVTKREGGAVQRNRIKRRLRAAVQSVAQEPERFPTSTDVVILGRRDVLGVEFSALVDDIRRALAAPSRPARTSKPTPSTNLSTNPSAASARPRNGAGSDPSTAFRPSPAADNLQARSHP